LLQAYQHGDFKPLLSGNTKPETTDINPFSVSVSREKVYDGILNSPFSSLRPQSLPRI
jgi:hypothetical protein